MDLANRRRGNRCTYLVVERFRVVAWLSRRGPPGAALIAPLASIYEQVKPSEPALDLEILPLEPLLPPSELIWGSSAQPDGTVLSMFSKELLSQRSDGETVKSGFFGKNVERRRERLRGKPLKPWLIYVLGPIAYVALCVVAAIAALQFTEGPWLAIALTVVAYFVGHIPELFMEFRYKYREEWELAKGLKEKIR